MIRQKGITTANGVGILCLILLGGAVGEIVFHLIGPDVFMTQVRFMSVLFGIFLAPVWALYSDLKKLKDHGEVNRRQAREIDYRVDKGLRRLTIMAVMFLVSAVLIVSAGLWPKDPAVVSWFAKLVGAVVFLSFGFVLNVLYNMRELSRFETKLARAKQDKDGADKLLERLRKSRSNDPANHNAT